MDVVPYRDPSAFRRDLLPVLAADEVRHNLLLGILSTLIDRPDVYAEFGLWAIHHDGAPVAGAIRTPPFNLVLGDLPDRAAAGALAGFLRDEPLPGSVGVLPGGEWFPEAFSTAAGVTPQVKMRQGIYALTEVRPVPAPAGLPRRAGPADHAVVLAWLGAFQEEVFGEPEDDPAMLESIVDRRLAEDDPLLAFWVWEADGEVVSLSGHGGLTPTGIRIGPVYTPPELRGGGYATALVAAQSQWLLEQGRRACFLYTDLANPTSNAIYERIGYRRWAESVEVRFE